MSTPRQATKPLLGPRSVRTGSILLIVVGVPTAAAAAVLLFWAVVRDSATVQVTLSNQVRLTLDESLQLPAGIGLAGDGIGVRLITTDLPAGTRVLITMGTALPLVCGGLAALALSRVLWTLSTEEPFRRRTARLLVVVAALCGWSTTG